MHCGDDDCLVCSSMSLASLANAQDGHYKNENKREETLCLWRTHSVMYVSVFVCFFVV